MRKSVIIVTVAVVATSAGILSLVASIGGFDPSKRVITDPIEGTETKIVENPTPPDHPAFPASNSSSTNGTGQK